MLSMQYTHRLPADYDMNLIRRRAAQRGPLWDDAAGLAFKAFAIRERGRHGSQGNAYASVYLWLDTGAATDFLTDERFQNVIDGFGRPAVETWLPLDARAAEGAGAGRVARTLYREDLPVPDGSSRSALRAEEIRRNDALLQRPDTVAVITSLDVSSWRLLRLTLSSGTPDDASHGAHAGASYEILHLASPGVARLA